jgi:hypothetical protein
LSLNIRPFWDFSLSIFTRPLSNHSSTATQVHFQSCIASWWSNKNWLWIELLPCCIPKKCWLWIQGKLSLIKWNKLHVRIKDTS